MCDRINGLGKFEGEACYAKDVYLAMLDGATEMRDADQRYDIFAVDGAFRTAHELDGTVVAILLTESNQGFVECEELTQSELSAFEERAQAYADENPDEDVLHESLTTLDGRTYWHTGKLAVTVSDDAESPWPALDAWMEGHGYFPNVYMISDHGNVHLMMRPANL